MAVDFAFFFSKISMFSPKFRIRMNWIILAAAVSCWCSPWDYFPKSCNVSGDSNPTCWWTSWDNGRWVMCTSERKVEVSIHTKMPRILEMISIVWSWKNVTHLQFSESLESRKPENFILEGNLLVVVFPHFHSVSCFHCQGGGFWWSVHPRGRLCILHLSTQ